jgi:carboxyl-terminal processing protease
MTMERGHRRTRLAAGTVVVVAVTLVFMFTGFGDLPENDVFFKIGKSIDVFGRVYREITANYVDEVDPEKFMEAGIDGMLETLDPYTVYIQREDGDEVELVTSGKYGGIGVTIGQRDGAIQVITVMEGYSAERQGILPGDRILEVDGVSVATRKPDDVRSLTRGDPGTEVRVLVEREGEPAPMSFVLIREEIQMKNVTYAGFLEPGIGYVRLERFSRTAGDEMRNALRDLKLKGELRGVIVDLRGNPGGLLDAAVEVVSKFVPRGSTIVTTKGRRSEADKQYASVEEPLLPATPLVLLTDRNSASASEIVAGAMQDLDRGLIVGTRTFGKGLVQTILPLNYGAQLKITTARYYTPSGRSIQEIDYIHRNPNGVFGAFADSMKKEFTTIGGRAVYEHGGIAPDSTIEETDPGPMVRQLQRKSLFFRFATRYAAAHKGENIGPVTPAVLDEFRTFLAQQEFDFQEDTETRVKDLRTAAEKLHYADAVLADLDRLATDLASEKLRAFDRYRNHIERELAMELMARTKGESGRIEASFAGDTVLQAGVALLNSPVVYARKLKP